jgi:hypothetical protein
MKTPPYFAHDCDKCIYLGSGDIIRCGLVDFYRCPGYSLGPTAIVRFGNHGREYWSMPESMLQEASVYSSYAGAYLNNLERRDA